ncbi:MAG: N-acetylmuramoyl-L-alanine amidase [Pseudomonadota bacterium]
MRTRYVSWIPLAGFFVSVALAAPGDRLFQRGRAEFFSAQSISDAATRRTKLKRAISDLRKFAERNPNHAQRPAALFDLGSAYEGLADPGTDREDAVRALGYYRELVRSYPRNGLADDALYRIAEICARVFKDAACSEQARSKIRGQYADGDMVRLLAPAHAPSRKPENVAANENQPRADAEAPRSDPVPGAAATAKLKDARVERLPSEIVIRLILDGEPKVFHSDRLVADPELKLPERFYVDLDQARAGPSVKAPEFSDSDPVMQLRLGQNGTAARIVLDLRSGGVGAAGPSAQLEANELRIRVPRPTSVATDTSAAADAPSADPAAPAVQARTTETAAVQPKVQAKRDSRFKIVLDAGHGGEDAGAKGRKGTEEKDVCLAIVKRLDEMLRKRPEYDVYLTRDRDRFVPLGDRTKYANQVGGDLFISVHANAAPRKSAEGVSTYFLDNHDDEESLRVALRENDVPGGVPLGKRPESDEQYLEIMKSSMVKNFHTVQSTDLAHDIQAWLLKELRRGYSGVESLGVRSARFYVLTGATMPAVLIETSFISNSREEKRLRDPGYQKLVAKAVVEAIDQYFKSSVGRGDHTALYQN